MLATSLTSSCTITLMYMDRCYRSKRVNENIIILPRNATFHTLHSILLTNQSLKVYQCTTMMANYVKIIIDLQRSIDIVTDWSDGNFLTQCKYMIKSRRRDPTLPQPSLTICGVDLEKVDTMKYLGECISKNLSWSTHVNTVCSKLNEYWVCCIVDFTIIPPVR